MSFNALSFFGEGIPAGVGAFAQTTRERQRRESQEAMMRRMEEQQAEDRRMQRALIITMARGMGFDIMGDPAMREAFAPSARDVQQSGANVTIPSPEPARPYFSLDSPTGFGMSGSADINEGQFNFTSPPPWSPPSTLRPMINYGGILNPTGGR